MSIALSCLSLRLLAPNQQYSSLMKRIIYTHSTALAFWERRAALGQPCNFKPIGITPNTVSAPTAAEAQGRCPLDAPLPIHVMLPKQRARCSLPSIMYHYCTRRVPKGSYLPINEHVAMASPAMLFYQLSSDLSLPQLIELGYRLCASFVKVEEDFDQRTFVSCDALTSVKEIANLLNRLDGFPNITKCRKALTYVHDNAASPREVAVAMLLTMPTSQGGFGLPHAELNAEIPLSQLDRNNLGRHHLCVDMLWRKSRVALEYDSDQWHASVERLTYDSRRRNQLKALGYEVITVTNNEIKDGVAFQRVANALAKALGKRLRVRSSSWAQKHQELRQVLLK